MGSSSTSGIIIFSIIVLVVLIAAYFISSSGKNLNSIKSKPVGDGQFGDQKWATKQELNNNLVIIPYEPEKWRNGENRPQLEGIILGAVKTVKKYLRTLIYLIIILSPYLLRVAVKHLLSSILILNF